MRKRLLVRADLCSGCGACELACAIAKTGQYHPARARIRVRWEKVLGSYTLHVCSHCVDAPCITACLMNIIEKQPGTGLVARRVEQCIGCRACQVACPFDASCYDDGDEVVVNCDCCGGEPECVRYCPTGALQYGILDTEIGRRRANEGLKRLWPGEGSG